MDIIQPALFSNDITTIASYKTTPFSESDGNGAYAIRVIEIYRAYKMRDSLLQFSRLTGHPALFTEPTLEEITSLIDRGISLIEPEEEKLNACKAEVSKYNKQLETASKKVTRISDIKNSDTGNGLPHSQKVQIAFAGHKKQAEAVEALKGLLGLLREPINSMMKQDESGEIRKQASRLTHGVFARYLYTRGNVHHPPFRSCEFIWNELDALESAVESIVRECTTPKDKYQLQHGGEKRAELHREYYNVNNAALRMTISARDYVNWALSKDNSSDSKACFYKNGL